MSVSKDQLLIQCVNKPKVKPFLKWAGGKQQLWNEISRHIPNNYNKYIEPFLGGGAIFFGLQPEVAILSDTNPDLVNLYEVVRDNVDELIYSLKEYINEEKFYYYIRGLDSDKLTKLERAARIMYLNKVCFNGLYRVNKKGQFNVPFGKYKNPTICDEEGLRAANIALEGKTLILGNYLELLQQYAEPDDLIYLDPPYLPISTYSDFKRYTKEFFYEEDHIKLANEVHRLYELGCNVILSNSNHPLVYELYRDYKIEVHKTKRYINSDAKNRHGQDILVLAQPRRKSFKVIKPEVPNSQLDRFPGTRYMGSKYNLLDIIWDISKEFRFESVLDAFSGSGVVSYMFKTKDKTVFSNDFMTFSASVTKAIVENNNVTISDKDIKFLLEPGDGNGFVYDTFKDLYFSDEENIFIDDLRARIDKLQCQYKKALAIASLSRACLKRRPRGIFTYVGYRYDDGRRDLQKSLKEHFLESVYSYNDAVFDNGKQNLSFNRDTMELRRHADLVYIDPPYYSPLSDNEYTRRYHFVEGLAKRWEGLQIQWDTKTKKFKKYPTPFGTKVGAYDAFDKLFAKYKDSIIIVSYSSNAFPTMAEMLELLSKYKDKVEVNQIEHRYSFGNQGHKVDDNNNEIQEYIFVGY